MIIKLVLPILLVFLSFSITFVTYKLIRKVSKRVISNRAKELQEKYKEQKTKGPPEKPQSEVQSNSIDILESRIQNRRRIEKKIYKVLLIATIISSIITGLAIANLIRIPVSVAERIDTIYYVAVFSTGYTAFMLIVNKDEN